MPNLRPAFSFSLFCSLHLFLPSFVFFLACFLSYVHFFYFCICLKYLWSPDWHEFTLLPRFDSNFQCSSCFSISSTVITVMSHDTQHPSFFQCLDVPWGLVNKDGQLEITEQVSWHSFNLLNTDFTLQVCLLITCCPIFPSRFLMCNLWWEF